MGVFSLSRSHTHTLNEYVRIFVEMEAGGRFSCSAALTGFSYVECLWYSCYWRGWAGWSDMRCVGGGVMWNLRHS